MRLNAAERRMALAGGAVLAALILVQFAARPLARRTETLGRAVASGEKALEQLRHRAEEHVRLRTELEALRARLAEDKDGPAPLTLLETYAKECGLQRNVAYMKTDKTPLVAPYAQTRVTVRLEGVSLDQVVALMLRVEGAPRPLGMRSLNVRASAKDPKRLDAVLDVVAVGRE